MGRFKSEKFTEFKRRTILDAASQVFTEKGMEKASMRAIAAAADLTTGALYTMFAGKEDIYAELLRESLIRLYDFVAEKTATATSPEEAVHHSIRAFYDYYQDRLFEVQLGMHSFDGFRHGSLGREKDAELNALLLQTLNVFAETIATAAPKMTAAAVTAERNAIFACLMGTLSLLHTGRAESIGTSSDEVLETQIAGLLARLFEFQ